VFAASFVNTAFTAPFVNTAFAAPGSHMRMVCRRSVTKGRTAFKGKSKGATPSSPDGNTRDLTDVVLGDASPSPSSSPPPLPSASTLHNPLHATPPSPAPRKTLKQSTETLRRSLSEHGRELGGTDKLTTSTGTNSKFTVSFGANENANNLASSISFNAEDGTAAEPASDSESDDSDPEDTNAAEYDGVTKFNVSKEVTAANRRLKKYQVSGEGCEDRRHVVHSASPICSHACMSRSCCSSARSSTGRTPRVCRSRGTSSSLT